MNHACATAKEALRANIADMMNVSTISASLKKIIDLTGNPNTIIHDLVKAIECDQALAMKVIAASNGAFYGFTKKISTVSQAILILGFDTVRALAITTTVFNSTNSKNNENLLAMWAHSLEAAEAAVLIAKKTGLADKETAFISGLLHDIGRPILFQTSGDMAALKRHPVDKEEMLFGASHAEAGSWFAERFKLPESCTKSIRYHHSPEECAKPDKLPTLVAITYFANLVVTEAKDAVASPDHDVILRSVKLTPEDLVSFAQEIKGKKDEISTFYKY